jgi:hypothetical protein
VNAAWWAIVGVAVAGALSLAKDWLIERRRTTFAWKKDREDDLRAARIASMLNGDELETHAMNYELLDRLGRTPDRPVTDTPNCGRLSGPAYAIDDETAIKVVEGTVEVVSEGHWKLFTRSAVATESGY